MYKNWMEDKRFDNDGVVYDNNNSKILLINDDYDYWESEQERLTDPLSDDYNKYDNE